MVVRSILAALLLVGLSIFMGILYFKYLFPHDMFLSKYTRIKKLYGFIEDTLTRDDSYINAIHVYPIRGKIHFSTREQAINYILNMIEDALEYESEKLSKTSLSIEMKKYTNYLTNLERRLKKEKEAL